MSDYISVVNWEKYQQYKDRRPTWIKAYTSLVDDYEFAHLPDEAKAHVFGLWILAALTGNQIPNDPAWIAKKINATAQIDFDQLKSCGFIQYESLKPSVRIVETKRSPEKRREEKRREETETSPRQPAGAWSSRAVDLWNGRFGEGSVKAAKLGGRLCGALKPLIEIHGEERTLAALGRYLAETTHPSPNPQDFAGHFAKWLPVTNLPTTPKLEILD